MTVFHATFEPGKLGKLFDGEVRSKNLRALKYRAREWVYGLVRPELPDPIFIVGCSRSGTTVTFETLGSVPGLWSFPHEIPQFWNGLHGPSNNGFESEAASSADARPEHRHAALRWFYARLGSGRFLDKTCINVMRVSYLHALFPSSRFVYIHRDGRDNVGSLMNGWRANRHFDLEQFFGPAPEPVAINGGEFRHWSFFLPPGWREFNRASLEEVCAYQWITANRLALEAAKSIPGEQWIRLRYEDLFERPVDLFRETCERLDLPFDTAMRERCTHLRHTSLVLGVPERGKWKKHHRAAIERILPTLRPMLGELGYDPDR